MNDSQANPKAVIAVLVAVAVGALIYGGSKGSGLDACNAAVASSTERFSKLRDASVPLVDGYVGVIDCYQKTEKTFDSAWGNECAALGYQSGCSLPKAYAADIDLSYIQNIHTCFNSITQ